MRPIQRHWKIKMKKILSLCIQSILGELSPLTGLKRKAREKNIEIYWLAIFITVAAFKDFSFSHDLTEAIVSVHVTICSVFSGKSWDTPWFAKAKICSSFYATFKFTRTFGVRLKHLQMFALMGQPAFAFIQGHSSKLFSGSYLICNHIKAVYSTLSQLLN